jgi:putative flippase GtrA
MLHLTDRFLRLQGIVFSKYLLVSIAALAVDMGTFFQLIAWQASPAAASSAAYSLGIVVHWWLSSRLVFAGRVLPDRGARAAQQAKFVLSALVGLALTTGIVTFGSRMGLDPRIAKLIAVGASFLTVWHLRNHYVFRPSRLG